VRSDLLNILVSIIPVAKKQGFIAVEIPNTHRSEIGELERQ
jgi:hypothetical protein